MDISNISSNINTITTIKNSGKKINNIYHLSDIHIRPRERHVEYLEVFEKVYNILKFDIKNIDKSVLILTGDIVHNKTEMSPELISVVSTFLNNLCKITDVIIIPGNHDCNLSNKQRMDALTPIVQCLSVDNKNNNLFYLKYSGYYRYQNIVFGVSSIIDNVFLSSPSDILLKKFKIKNDYNIALYHGAVHGTQTDVGYRMNKNDLTVDNFKGYHYVLLGDIHKHQYVDRYKRIAYSGSLIQQSFGEQPDNHGILRWNLKYGLSKLIQVNNNYGYFKLHIKDGKLPDVELVTNSTILCVLENTNNLQYLEIINSLKKKYNICEIKPQSLDIRQKCTEIENEKTNYDYSCDTIEKYAKEIGLTNDQISKVSYFHGEIYKTTSKKENINSDNKSAKWNIVELKFTNTLSYGKNNIINFEEYDKNKIIGIFGPNHYGKSAILDIILFCLFDKCSRGDRRDILNKNKNKMQCSLLFRIGNEKYLIERRGFRNKNGTSVKIDVEFFKISNIENKEVMVNLTGIDKNDTNRKIVNIVGDFNDYIATCICLQRQGKTSTFTDMTNLQKKEYLYEILKLNIYENCYQTAHTTLVGISSELKLLENSFKNIDIEKITSTIKLLKKEIKRLEQKKISFDTLLTIIDNIINNTNVQQLVQYDNLNKFNLSTHENILNAIKNTKNQIKLLQITDNTQTTNKLNILVEKLKTLELENNNRLNSLINTKTDNATLIEVIQSHLIKKEQVPQEWFIDAYATNEEKISIQNKIDNINNILSKNFNCMDKISRISKVKQIIKNLQDNKKFIYDKFKKSNIDQINIIFQQNEMELKLLNQNIAKIMVEILDTYCLDKVNYAKIKKNIGINKPFKNHVVKNVKLIYKLNNINNNIINKLKNHNNKWLSVYKKDLNLIKNFNENNNDIYENMVDKKKMLDNNKVELLTAMQTIKHNNKIQIKIDRYEKELEILSYYNSKKLEVDNFIKEKTLLLEEIQNLENKLINFEKYKTIIKNNEFNDKIINEIQHTIQINSQKEKTYKENRQKIIDKVKTLEEKINNQKSIVENRKQLIFNKNLLIKYHNTFIQHTLSKSVLTKWIKNRTNIINNINSIQNTLYQKKFELDSYNKKLEQYLEKRKEYDNISLRFQTCQLYSQIVDRDGLPYQILKKYLPIIEQDINQILNSMVKFNVEFTYVGKSNTSVKQCKSNLGAIDINICRHGIKPYNVHLASGFEQFIINLAIRMTLCKISLNAKPNFLIIDEGWACFDSDNLGNISLIMNYIKQQYDHIVIISHLDSLKYQSDYIINIEKNGKFSCVKENKKIKHITKLHSNIKS